MVVGNGNYANVTPLANPVSDARLMSDTLRKVGFEVVTITDASQDSMKRGIADFGRMLRAAGPDTTALFYYAGHAVQSFGNNYLLPVDANISDQADLDLDGVEADWIIRQLYSARVRTNIVILDACRNNPFSNVAGLNEGGLAEMNAPTGSFIALATAPGQVALDGTGSNSPYTRALSDEILAPTQPIEQLFKSVRVRVLEETDNRQTPWESSSLTTDFNFREAPAQTEISQAELNFWNTVKDSGDKSQIELFVRLYPNSTYRFDAEERVAELERSLSMVVPDDVPDGSGPITFISPLTEGDQHIIGRSIQEIFTTSSPMFPPIEGLPEELWKGQKCSNCHKWTRELLCEQGSFYLSADATRSLDKKHPLGGTFKRNLKAWAEAGCL